MPHGDSGSGSEEGGGQLREEGRKPQRVSVGSYTRLSEPQFTFRSGVSNASRKVAVNRQPDNQGLRYLHRMRANTSQNEKQTRSVVNVQSV